MGCVLAGMLHFHNKIGRVVLCHNLELFYIPLKSHKFSKVKPKIQFNNFKYQGNEMLKHKYIDIERHCP